MHRQTPAGVRAVRALTAAVLAVTIATSVAAPAIAQSGTGSSGSSGSSDADSPTPDPTLPTPVPQHGHGLGAVQLDGHDDAGAGDTTAVMNLRLRDPHIPGNVMGIGIPSDKYNPGYYQMPLSVPENGGDATQLWNLRRIADGGLVIQNAATGQCVNSPDDNAKNFLVPCAFDGRDPRLVWDVVPVQAGAEFSNANPVYIYGDRPARAPIPEQTFYFQSRFTAFRPVANRDTWNLYQAGGRCLSPGDAHRVLYRAVDYGPNREYMMGCAGSHGYWASYWSSDPEDRVPGLTVSDPIAAAKLRAWAVDLGIQRCEADLTTCAHSVTDAQITESAAVYRPAAAFTTSGQCYLSNNTTSTMSMESTRRVTTGWSRSVKLSASLSIGTEVTAGAKDLFSAKAGTEIAARLEGGAAWSGTTDSSEKDTITVGPGETGWSVLKLKGLDVGGTWTFNTGAGPAIPFTTDAMVFTIPLNSGTSYIVSTTTNEDFESATGPKCVTPSTVGTPTVALLPVSGSVPAGTPLTVTGADFGTGSGDQVRLRYRWFRQTPSGGQVLIDGATTDSYTTTPEDAGARVRASVTAYVETASGQQLVPRTVSTVAKPIDPAAPAPLILRSEQ